MSYTPGTLFALRNYLIGQTHLSAVQLGVVGNAAHTSGYHLGRDRIFSSTGKGWNDYSIRTLRDRRGLTNAAMAMDIGSRSTDGRWTPRRLRSMSVWLVAACRRNAPGTSDIREVIYSPDGISVLRWDRQRGFASAPRLGEADSSHRTHTHISWYRDSENRSKLAPFVRYFEPDTVAEYRAIITGPVMTYTLDGRQLEPISGLSVLVAERIKVAGVWRYRIVAGKYAGRYLPAHSNVRYIRL